MISTQLRSQTKFDLLSFWRNPAAAFFTVILPILFLVLFAGLFGNEIIEDQGIRVANFYVPGILTMSVVSATMVNLSMTTTTDRENGVLKRVRGTPLRPWVFLAAQIAAAFVVMVISAVLLIVLARVAFDVRLRPEAIPSLVISLLIGTAAFSALGIALSTIIPSVRAAPAITNALVLPLYFVSDVFVVTDNTPRFFQVIGDVFPIKHLAGALLDCFNPFETGIPTPWADWGVIVLWGMLGAWIALRRFTWEPRGS